MTKVERAMKWLEEEYGIKSEAELDAALAKSKLDIGIFVSPLPAEALRHLEEPIPGLFYNALNGL